MTVYYNLKKVVYLPQILNVQQLKNNNYEKYNYFKKAA